MIGVAKAARRWAAPAHAEEGIDTAALEAKAEAVRAEAATVIYVAIDGRLAGFVGIADPIKATTPQAIAALRRAGLRVVTLTGDGKTTAEAVGRALDIDEIVADVLPEDKAAIVQKLKREGRVVAMAGDGVNDAPRWPWPPAIVRHRHRAVWRVAITLLKGDLLASCARAGCRRRRCAHRQNLFLSFAYTSRASRWRRVLYPSSATAVARSPRRPWRVVGQRDRQRVRMRTVRSATSHEGCVVTQVRARRALNCRCGVALVPRPCTRSRRPKRQRSRPPARWLARPM